MKIYEVSRGFRRESFLMIIISIIVYFISRRLLKVDDASASRHGFIYYIELRCIAETFLTLECYIGLLAYTLSPFNTAGA